MFNRYDRKTMTAYDDERGLALKPGGGRLDMGEIRYILAHKDWEFMESTADREEGIKRTYSKEKNADGFLDRIVEVADDSRVVITF